VHTHLSGRRRTALVVPAALAISLATAAPAVAHIDVTADGAQAGAGPITLSFSAAAESDNVGIAGVRTQLPTGIAPADVVLAAAPAGWVLVPTADGFEISGPPIEPGAAAEYSITVAELPPDTTELAFPTIQRYADGREDAWIEPEIEGAPAPQMPAPTLEVAPAAAPPEASTPAPSSAAPSSPAEATASTQSDTAGDADDEESDAGTVGIVSGLVAAAVIGGGVWWWRSRRAR
jgi:hypothetical protein